MVPRVRGVEGGQYPRDGTTGEVPAETERSVLLDLLNSPLVHIGVVEAGVLTAVFFFGNDRMVNPAIVIGAAAFVLPALFRLWARNKKKGRDESAIPPANLESPVTRPWMQIESIAGPAKWSGLALPLLVWVALMWAAAEAAGSFAAFFVFGMGLIVYYAILPKGPGLGRSRWWKRILIVVVGVVTIAIPFLLESLDRELSIAGFGVWAVLMVQFILWLESNVRPAT